MGNIQFLNEKVLFTAADNKVAMSADCCCAAPCTCPAGLAAGYRLVGYTDGDLVACDSCDDDLSMTVWDGSFPTLISGCNWQEQSNRRINGKQAVAGADQTLKLDVEGDPVCKWIIVIYCSYPATEIWAGEKTTGLSPEGTYTRTGGCDTTAELEVEAIP